MQQETLASDIPFHLLNYFSEEPYYNFVWGLGIFWCGVWGYFGLEFRGNFFMFGLHFAWALGGIVAWGLEGIWGWVLGEFWLGVGGSFDERVGGISAWVWGAFWRGFGVWG